MTYPKWPSEFELRRKNRPILAERLHWPDGAVQACADLEERHPGWRVWWLGENSSPGWELPAGFSASYETRGHATTELKAFVPTAEELEPLLVEVPEHDYSKRGCDFCRARY
jgi:hypothetical protein